MYMCCVRFQTAQIVPMVYTGNCVVYDFDCSPHSMNYEPQPAPFSLGPISLIITLSVVCLVQSYNYADCPPCPMNYEPHVAPDSGRYHLIITRECGNITSMSCNYAEGSVVVSFKISRCLQTVPVVHTKACAGGPFPFNHWHKYCTCTQATCTVWWWCVDVFVVVLCACG